MHALAGTVSRLIDFYVLKYENDNIDKIYIIGDGSANQDVINTVQSETHIITTVLDTVKGITLTGKAKTAPIGIFANAIGAGLSSVGLDNDMEKKRHETNYVSASILMIILVAAVAIALVSAALIPYNTAKSEQTELEKKRTELEPAKVVYDDYNAMLNLIAKVRYGNALTQNSNDGIIEFLEELEKTLPSNVEVSDFSSDDSQCVITMRVDDKETAAGVINKLREFESLDSLTVNSIVEETLDSSVDDELSSDNKIINFTVTANYKVETPVEP
jgi:hypothetical protein